MLKNENSLHRIPHHEPKSHRCRAHCLQLPYQILHEILGMNGAPMARARFTMKAPKIEMCLVAVMIIAQIGCSSIVGPHQIKVEQGAGVSIVHLEGYGCNSLHQNDTAAIHLGWFQRTFVFEELGAVPGENSDARYSIFSRLPGGVSLHQSVVDAGVCAAWEPTFRGFSVGFQSRSISRLPIHDSMAFEVIRSNGNRPISRFSLHRTP